MVDNLCGEFKSNFVIYLYTLCQKHNTMCSHNNSNGLFPTDIEPPEFVLCPHTQYITLGPVGGPVIAEFITPIVQDNSGRTPNIATSPPGLESPYRFDQVRPLLVGNTDNKKICFAATIEGGSTIHP
jgi:hypothetical protein